MRYQKTQRIALVSALFAMAILAVGTLPAQKAPQIPADLTKAASTGQLFANKTNGDIQDELTKAGFSLEQMNAALDQLGQQNEAAIQKATQNNTPAPAANSNNSAANPNQQSGTNVSLPPETSATGSITVANHCPTAANFSVSLAPPQASSWISVPQSILSSGLSVGASGATSFNYQVSSNGMNPGSQIAGSIVVKCLNCTNCTQTGTSTFTVTLNVVSDTSGPGGGGGGGSPPPGGGGGSNPPPPSGGGSQPGSTPGSSSTPGGGTTGGTNPPGGGGPNTGGPTTTSGPTSSFPQTGPGTQSGGTNPGNSGGPTTTGGSNPNGGGPTTTGGGSTPNGGGPTTTGGGSTPNGDTTVTGTTPTPTTTSTTPSTPTPTTTTGTTGFWSGLMGALTLALGGVGLLTGSGKPPQTTARPPATGTTPQTTTGTTPQTTTGTTPQTTTNTGGGTPLTQTTPAPPATGDWGVTGNAPTAGTTEKAGGAPTGTPTTVGKNPTPTTPGQPTPATQTGTPPQTGDWGVTGSGPVPATGGLATAPGNTPQTVSKDHTPATTGQPTSNTPQTTSTPPTGGWGVAGTGPVAATGEKAGGPGQTVARDGGNTPGTTEKTGGGGTPPTTSKDGDGTWGATGTGPTGSGPGTKEKPAPGPGQTIAKGPDPTDPPAPKPGDRNTGGGQTFSKGTTQADLEQANRPPTDDELKAAKPGDGPDDYATREKKLRLGMGMITINNESAPPIGWKTPKTQAKPKPFVPTTQEDKDRLNYINTKLNDAITKAKAATDLQTKAKYTRLAKFWLFIRDHYGFLSQDKNFMDMIDDLQKTEGTYMYPEHEMLVQMYQDKGEDAVKKYLQDSAEMEFYKGVGAIVDMGGNLGLGATFSAIESELAAISNEAQTGRSSSSSREAPAEEEPPPSQHVEDDSNLPEFEKAPVDEEGGWGTRQNWNFEDDSPPVLTDPKTGEAIPATVDPETGALKPVGGGQSAPATTSAPSAVDPKAPTVDVTSSPTKVGPEFDASKTQPDLVGGDHSPAKGMQKTAYDDFSKVPVDPNEAPGTRLPGPNFPDPPPNKQMSKPFIKFHGNIQENPSDPGINPATGEKFFEK